MLKILCIQERKEIKVWLTSMVPLHWIDLETRRRSIAQWARISGFDRGIEQLHSITSTYRQQRHWRIPKFYLSNFSQSYFNEELENHHTKSRTSLSKFSNRILQWRFWKNFCEWNEEKMENILGFGVGNPT